MHKCQAAEIDIQLNFLSVSSKTSRADSHKDFGILQWICLHLLSPHVAKQNLTKLKRKKQQADDQATAFCISPLESQEDSLKRCWSSFYYVSLAILQCGLVLNICKHMSLYM